MRDWKWAVVTELGRRCIHVWEPGSINQMTFRYPVASFSQAVERHAILLAGFAGFPSSESEWARLLNDAFLMAADGRPLEALAADREAVNAAVLAYVRGLRRRQ